MTETNKNTNLVYISLVAIVAIVAMVILINGNGNTPNNMINPSDNTAGQAFSSRTTTIGSNQNLMFDVSCTRPPASECARCCTGWDSGCVQRCTDAQKEWGNE